MHRNISKTLASLALATAVTVPGIASAPAAEAATQTPRLSVTDNKGGFNKKTNGAFVITVHARHDSGANMAGRGWLYINGDRIGGRFLHRGKVTFKVSRAGLPNNKTSAITVRIDPRNGDIRNRNVVRHVKDRVPTKRTSAGQKVVQVAKAQVGDPYTFGSAGPSAYDCSGLVVYSYRHATGKRIPHSSDAIRRAGRPVSAPRPGDVVWTPGHVSVYAGNGRVVEAAKPGTRVRLIERWQRNPVYLRF